jgi:hypothetical protein
MGNGEWGMGNGEWGMGSGGLFPTPHSLLPIPHSLFFCLAFFCLVGFGGLNDYRSREELLS